MNGRSQMQGGKNWILPKEINANRFFWDYHWLEIWKNILCPSMALNGGSVAIGSDVDSDVLLVCVLWMKLYCKVSGWHLYLYDFPSSVLYGEHSWTYGNIIKTKHYCTTTNTCCDTYTIKISILLWQFLDVIHTFNNSLSATATFNYATLYDFSEMISTGM